MKPEETVDSLARAGYVIVPIADVYTALADLPENARVGAARRAAARLLGLADAANESVPDTT